MDTFDLLYSKFTGPFNGNGKNRTTDCPFCEKENKFSLNVETGQSRCLSDACYSSDLNHVSFMTEYHKSWLEYTEDEHYEELSELRGPSVEVFKKCRLAYDQYHERWLVPYKNPLSKFLCNLGYFYTSGEKPFVIFKPNNVQGKCPLVLYNPYQPISTAAKAGKIDTVRIVEGEWDLWAMLTMALNYHTLNPEESKFPYGNYIYLAVPGATNFVESCRKWFDHLHNAELYYDYDEAGAMGTQKAAFILSSWGKGVKSVRWDTIDYAEENNDIRDLLLEYPSPEEQAEVYTDLTSSIGDVESIQSEDPEELSAGYVASIADISEIPDYDRYIDKYEKEGKMYLNEHNRMAIATTMAIGTSQYMPGEALWFFLKGQPGCGKTTLIESFGGNNEYFDYASRITAKNLVSGWQGGDDPSLITQINGKCFFIKDFTVVLGMAKEQRKEVFNLFRDIYDGTLKITFGNGKVCNFHNLRFNMVAGVTDEIMKHSDATVGERFLRLDYMGPTADDVAIIDTALEGYGQSSVRKQRMTEATLGYVKFLKRNEWDVNNLPRISASGRKILSSLARYTAYVRTRVDTDRTDGITYKPRPEVASRLSLQYAKLAFALEKVFFPSQKYGSEIDFSDTTLEHVAKVAYDTAESFNNDVLMALYKQPRLNRKSLSARLNLPSTRMHKVITELKQTKLIRAVLAPGESPDSQGRPAEYYYLASDFEPVMEMVKNRFS